jgi:hypothetical protein
MKSSLSIVLINTLLILYDRVILRKIANNNGFSCFKFQLLLFIET